MSGTKSEVSSDDKIKQLEIKGERVADFFVLIGLDVLSPELEPENHGSKLLAGSKC